MLARSLTLALVVGSLLPAAGCFPQECSDEVWIQVQNYYPETLTVAISTFAPLCDDNGATLEGAAELDAPQNTGGTDMPYFGSDPASGSTFVFTVVSEGALADESVSCTLADKGIELTYARMEVDFNGELACTCGFEEWESDPEFVECI